MKTFWFWYGKRCLTAVTAVDEQSARMHALEQLDKVPGVFCNYPLENPSEFRTKLLYATVKTYE